MRGGVLRDEKTRVGGRVRVPLVVGVAESDRVNKERRGLRGGTWCAGDPEPVKQ